MANKPGTSTFQVIARAYGWNLVDVRPLSSYYKKVAAYSMDTESGRYFVKPYRGSSARLARIVRYMRLLKRKGYRHMPRWVRTTSGKRWTRVGGRLYYATEWIDGQRLGGPEDYYRLGRALAKLHRRTRGRTGSRGTLAAKAIADLRKQHLRFARELASVSARSTPAGRWFRQHGMRCLAVSRRAWSRLGQADIRAELLREQRSPSLIHGDITSFNVLLTQQQLYLIDWEMAKPKSAYVELVKALTNTTGFSIPEMASLLRGYESIRPLRKSQRRLIAALYSVPREGFLAAAAARHSSSPEVFRIFRSTWNSRLAANKWMNRWARQG
ncbi:hypothetical protein J31TS4_24010 [Paenibacillus sp. J31TS4]|uniref:aminoglycoside phosphotransferase family protein n=1 Tax=Paenibacillus sp. J31TS4 TaxID=2807195 RepID=UPI001B1205F8|nr:aminoglycoside phosphotransferase family protein [Paenibacillus sp. J31TS4]GIP39121.1 hypothetical protein J31TS4_24010 [Paenibacillus sp. J31TS4]